MAVNKKEIRFIYYSYKKESPDDYREFKKELIDSAKDRSTIRDIVVEFSDRIVSYEIGVLAKVLNEFRGTVRNLKVIGDNKIREAIDAVNLTKLGNFSIYSSLDELIQRYDELE